MRKSDILSGPCEGGPWSARILTSTNALVWVPDAGFGCYRFQFDAGVWQWHNGDANRVDQLVSTKVNANGADAPRVRQAALADAAE
jgi:hypothetical protein